MLEGITWPSWIGTPSQFALLVVVLGSVVVAWIKVWPKLLELNLTDQTKKRSELYDQIKTLKDDVKLCKDNCDAQEIRLKAQIDQLQGKINNEAFNRVQSEISLVNTLVQILPSDQLRLILVALEKRQILLRGPNVNEIEGADDERT